MEEHTCMIPDVIILDEHQKFEKEHIDYIKSLNIPFQKTQYEGIPKFLGIDPYDLCASYYIGADWLSEQENKAVVVTPKIANIDYIEMYMCALKFDLSVDYFSKFYHIDFEKPAIKTSALKNQLTPLLIIHFLSIIKKIVKRGLKKGYVLKENNLKLKIKGKVQIIQNMRKNIINKREDHIYCQYHEYSVDIPENRLLKKALLYADSFLYTINSHKSYPNIKMQINNLLTAFIEVGENIELHEIKRNQESKLFKEYSNAIRLAIMILRHFAYSIRKAQTAPQETPVFWIDMSRLYEVYIYSLLYQSYGATIKFQVPGYFGTVVDFLKTDEYLIIDAKYKPQYNDNNKGIIDDIRQISAYSRDEKILKKLEKTEKTLPCLIIYPQKMIYSEDTIDMNDKCEEISNFDICKTLLSQSSPIRSYRNFYKLSVPLPIIKEL